MTKMLSIKSKQTIVLVLVCGLCLLHLLPPVECLFKLLKKKKFLEGFLVGFLIGNEFAGKKGSPKPPPMPM